MANADSLLTLLPQAEFVELADASYRESNLDRGLWNSILSTHLSISTGKFSIIPGFITAHGEAARGEVLRVWRNTYDPYVTIPAIILEARGDPYPNVPIMIQRLAAEARAYATGGGQVIYVIVVIGKRCRFFRFRRGDQIEWARLVYNPVRRRVTYDWDDGSSFDFASPSNQAAIRAFIREIKDYFQPPM